jgi:hypothetical protein
MDEVTLTGQRVPQCLLLLLCLLPASLQAQLHHRLETRLDPKQHSIEVTDTIIPVLEGDKGHLEVLPAQPAKDLSVLNITAQDADLVPRRYRLELPAGQERFVLRYRGRIRHALQQQGEEYARGFRETPGMIDDRGVFLAGQSYWYPHVEGERVSFELYVQLPPGWSVATTRRCRSTGAATPRRRRSI